MKVLLTGATGFIAQSLGPLLLTQGYKVRAMTRDINSAFVKNHPRYEWVGGDIKKPGTLENLANETDYLPMWIWSALAKTGDIGQLILHKRLPIDSQAVKKLFGMMWYGSASIQQDLGFQPRYTLEDMLPEIIRTYREERK